jgi:hypothetical protein
MALAPAVCMDQLDGFFCETEGCPEYENLPAVLLLKEIFEP